MILRVEIIYIVSLIDLFFQLTVSPPKIERMSLEKGPISIGKGSSSPKKNLIFFFHGYVSKLVSKRVTHQDCRIPNLQFATVSGRKKLTQAPSLPAAKVCGPT